jgi:serine/threonine protein kinase
MAFLETRNFREWNLTRKNTEEEKRPDSPTIMVTKSRPPEQFLLKSTLDLVGFYQKCNPNFNYDSSENPTRPLTKPCDPKYNDSYDNENYNYILYVNDKLVSPEGEIYVVLDTLGEGTFGQVVKCKNTKGNTCAAKVIKNKPAYYIQGLIEVKILSKLNKELDPNDTNHIVRMKDYFVFRNHLIIIFELLSINIYELLRKNGMRGFSLSLIRTFTKQMLEALCVMEKANIIHCDMKPENVLLINERPEIKVIDLGSACFENATIYTYIQSRYYRSPEVLIGLPYGSEIDSWSLGCICAELFIGIPLFPGANEYDQLYRIIQLLGPPPHSMVSEGRSKDKYFCNEGEIYRLKTREEYMQVLNI